MARNRSEAIPHPDLPAGIHAYYKARLVADWTANKTEHLWDEMPLKDKFWIERHWLRRTSEHKALSGYYRKLANSDGT